METIAFDLEQTKRTPLSLEHIAALRKVGKEAHYAQGQIVIHAGQAMDRFVFVEEGELLAGVAAGVYAGAEGLDALVLKLLLSMGRQELQVELKTLSMSDYLLSRLESDAKVTVHLNSSAEQLHGDHRLEGVTLRNAKTGVAELIETAGLFLMVGARPNTA
jgi:hypothetical protein